MSLSPDPVLTKMSVGVVAVIGFEAHQSLISIVRIINM